MFCVRELIKTHICQRFWHFWVYFLIDFTWFWQSLHTYACMHAYRKRLDWLVRNASGITVLSRRLSPTFFLLGIEFNNTSKTTSVRNQTALHIKWGSCCTYTQWGSMFDSGLGLESDHAIWEQPLWVVCVSSVYLSLSLVVHSPHNYVSITRNRGNNIQNKTFSKFTLMPWKKKGNQLAIFHSGSLQVTICYGA